MQNQELSSGCCLSTLAATPKKSLGRGCNNQAGPQLRPSPIQEQNWVQGTQPSHPAPCLFPQRGPELSRLSKPQTGSCLWCGKAQVSWRPNREREAEGRSRVPRSCSGSNPMWGQPMSGYVRAASGAGGEPPQGFPLLTIKALELKQGGDCPCESFSEKNAPFAKGALAQRTLCQPASVDT